MDDSGQTVALKRLHKPHAYDAFILAGHDPKRIGIGTGTDAHGLHLLCYVFAEIEMTSVGYAIGIYG
jgi:hypothetical protein